MKKFVFVLMPFNQEFNDIYELGIKTACQNEDIYCERVDEQFYEGSMLERIYNQINHADYIVADLTSKNPNVFYEVGYAHALGKKVILITQNGDDIPFDMKHYKHIIYQKNDITKLKEEINRKMRWYLENPKINEDAEFLLDIYINGIKLDLYSKKEILINLDKKTKYDETIQYSGVISVTVNNPSSELINCHYKKISIILPNSIPIDAYSRKLLPNNMQLVDVSITEDIYPQLWLGKNVDISFSNLNFDDEKILRTIHDGEVMVNMPNTTLKYGFAIAF